MRIPCPNPKEGTVFLEQKKMHVCLSKFGVTSSDIVHKSALQEIFRIAVSRSW